jgi:hypothetical protein
MGFLTRGPRRVTPKGRDATGSTEAIFLAIVKLKCSRKKCDGAVGDIRQDIRAKKEKKKNREPGALSPRRLRL